MMGIVADSVEFWDFIRIRIQKVEGIYFGAGDVIKSTKSNEQNISKTQAIKCVPLRNKHVDIYIKMRQPDEGYKQLCE